MSNNLRSSICLFSTFTKAITVNQPRAFTGFHDFNLTTGRLIATPRRALLETGHLMRSPTQLLHSRTRVRDRYALLPMEGFPPSRLPGWTGTEARIQASPALGAAFAWYHLRVSAGGGTDHARDDRVETFFYVLNGAVLIVINDDAPQRLVTGSFAFVPHDTRFRVEAHQDSVVIMIRKAYEPAVGIKSPKPLVGSASSVPATPFMGLAGARLQSLIPDELEYDLAVNIFTFDPGNSLPYVETHVMEHGLHVLEGKGIYFLGDDWMEVEQDDFIWMGPYCPQSFYATGPAPAKYIYYKNVNRDVTL